MSETPQGENWWQASDGKWYPPAPRSNDPYGPPPAYGSQPQQPAYGGPPYVSGPPQYVPSQTSGKATAVMVLGIVSLALMCGYGIGVIPAIVALALAPGAKREIQASGGRLQGEGQIKAGVICAWVTVGVVAVAVVAVIGIIIISAASSN